MTYTTTPYTPPLDLSWDDVLIDPAFSMVRSRSNVSLVQTFLGQSLELPVLSANMDTIASPELIKAMKSEGGNGVLHRFQTIEENILQFKEAGSASYVSIGTGPKEYERAEVLALAGATHFVIDVAHGASIQAVEQYNLLRGLIGENGYIVVGNFANARSIEDFEYHSGASVQMDAAKIGIGGGSLCTTRVVTGCGRSTLASIFDCSRLNVPLIADGGFRNSGDIAKALAAGASAVMLGGMLAGTTETPGETTWQLSDGKFVGEDIVRPKYYERGELKINRSVPIDLPVFKQYRGSASKESYDAQGKSSDHRTAEGEATMVSYKGPVSEVLQQIRAGLLSAFSYVGASNLEEFQDLAELIQISNATKVESSAHGVKK